MRAALYARYSSDQQSPLSIEHQLILVRELAERLGVTITAIHSDAAISGGQADRPGWNQVLRLAEARAIDVVLAEGLDRISRDLADIASWYRQLTSQDVAIITCQEGPVSILHIGFKGTMNEQFRATMKAQIRRGKRGRVEAGLWPGGRPYGYCSVKGEPGALVIDSQTAPVVFRIYAAYAAGQSPRAIAAALNEDRIPSPAGGEWNASTINGNTKRGHGILINPLYKGELTWNRTTKRFDPASRRARIKPLQVSDRITAARPDLAIVPTDLWQRAQDERAKRSQGHFSAARRPRKLLSGLMRCGCCGGAYVMHGAGRVACSTNKQRSTCANGRSIRYERVEEAALAAIRDEMLRPEAVAAFVEELRSSSATARRRQADEASRARRSIGEVERKIARIIALVEDGADGKPLVARLNQLEVEREALQTAMEAAPPPPVVDLHPNAAQQYGARIAALAATLELMTPAELTEARAALEELIEAVTIVPRNGAGQPGPLDLQVTLKLEGIARQLAPEMAGSPMTLIMVPPA